MRTAIIIIIAAIFLISCRKDTFNTSREARLSYSVDTLFFDTVFTSRGSVTQAIKIINPNNAKINIDAIQLAGGAASPFQLNINGIAAAEAEDIVLRAEDSLYIFVQVNVDPNAATTPFILTDSIQVTFNGNTHWVQLQAYGQNAIFLNSYVVDVDENWNADLPYVITGGLLVNEDVTLSLAAGTKVYLHANAPVLINGTLIAEGEDESRVQFSGDRLDDPYSYLPASWPGIFFGPASENNLLEYAIIKNAFQGIIVQEMQQSPGPKLTLSHCILKNIYDVGLLGINTSIVADNCLISNCGSNVLLVLGGQYDFTHCTVATYGSYYISHKSPVLQATDYLEQGGGLLTASLDATFTNCIFWGENGTVENEIIIAKKGAGAFDVQFLNSIYKAKDPVDNAVFTDCLLNTPPLFDSINTVKNIYDFHFTTHPESPAINAGKPTAFANDLDGKPRDAQPDIGCYEY